MMTRACFKQGQTTPDSHYKTPYDNSNLVITVVKKLPSPARGIYYPANCINGEAESAR